MTIELAPALVSGYLLAMVRAAAWVFVCPPLGNRTVPTMVKVGLAAALALVVGPRLAEQAVPLEAGPLLTAAVLQVAAGLALGFLGVLLFATFSFAGGLIDLVSGYSVAQLFDPGTSAPVSIFGQFYGVLATTLLFAIDGHLLLVRGFLTSFTAAPLTHLSTESLAKLLTGDIAMFFVAALEIAAPLLAALFLAEAALGLLARAAPQMNVFQLGLPVKILVTLTLAGLAIPILPDAVSGMANQVVRQGLGFMRG
ncbi:MAG TPA: flagellar biosynthetic protein FliR [Acidimicrobiia bacterium]|nr:flagellar biosynthetic protein FliR [Acidimicrobiia bacterium]